MALGPIFFSDRPELPDGMERKGMPVTKAKLGNKLTCSNCGAKFYDLKKKQPVCPRCGEDYVVQKPKTRRTAPPVEPAPVPAPDATETTESEDGLITSELENEILEDDEEGEEDTVIEDTSEIGGDDEDIDEVIGAVEGNNDENA